MFVKYEEAVSKKEIIGTVYGINNNPYKDENGNPTNGVTTGCHLHFAKKENDKNVNSLDYYDY